MKAASNAAVWLHCAGSAVHASQQLRKQAAAMSNSSSSHRASSSFKAAMDMSGERISGSSYMPSGPSSDASRPGDDAPWSSDFDDVELEKSNILMLGPTGGMLICV